MRHLLGVFFLFAMICIRFVADSDHSGIASCVVVGKRHPACVEDIVDAFALHGDGIPRWGYQFKSTEVFRCILVSFAFALRADSFIFPGGLTTKTCSAWWNNSVLQKVLSRLRLYQVCAVASLPLFSFVGLPTGAQVDCGRFAAVAVPSCHLVSCWPGLLCLGLVPDSKVLS